MSTPAPTADGLLHLRAAGVSLVIDARAPRLPRVLHWGADLGELDSEALESLAAAAGAPTASNTMRQPVPLGVLPEHALGWPGLPGLSGHRDGRDWSPFFSIDDVTRVSDGDGTGGALATAARDSAASLAVRIEIEMTPSGLVRLRAALRNEHAEDDYTLDGLVAALPVPMQATELLDLTGRHLRERAPQRQPFAIGSRVRDSRRGRTGLDATLILAAGTEGFGFRDGEVWGVHVGWSGNHRTYAERLPSSEAVLGGGELLLPGEVRLAPGEQYVSPWLYASYGRGLDAMSARFHEYLRARPTHPRRPRPVVLNTWEAVYFDHNLERLRRLADVAASVGVERFVLDDGWFRRRRDDRAGLGDWYVDETVWPEGLHPLVDHVRAAGMEFGLWVEPEMVNPDSDLARAHPEWIMATGGRQPPLSRSQQVLDLGHKEAYGHILELLDGLLTTYDIGYLKWDHNRDLVDAGHTPGGEPGVHEQTHAVYRLLDELRARHPGIEIESCSSGGGRVDLGILERTDRVWGSDCNDALERQSIQRWTELLLPPELIGAHVGPPHAHTTGRTHDLSFRAGTALFGHFGIEWDIASATPDERAELRRWVDCYKQLRGLLHSGRVVRADHPDPAFWVHGVVATDAASRCRPGSSPHPAGSGCPDWTRTPRTACARYLRPTSPGATAPTRGPRPGWPRVVSRSPGGCSARPASRPRRSSRSSCCCFS
jgi:alpha-galactosidase